MPGRLCVLSLNAVPHLTGVETGFVGGAETQEARLARHLATRGWRVTFLTEDHGPGAHSEGTGIAIRPTYRPAAGIPVLRFVHPRLTGVVRALRSTPADVYMTRTASIWSAVIAHHARRVGAASVLALSHDREARLDLNGFLNLRDRALFRRGLQSVDAVVAQTHRQAELLRDHGGREAVVVPNGIDPIPAPSDGDRTAEKRVPTVLWAGTFRPWKRPEIFLSLAELLPRVPFVMAGGPDPRHPDLYRRCLARSSGAGNLSFLGQVPPARMGELLDRTDILVSTSVEEGFPNTFLEAWARGIPVISTAADPEEAVSRHGAGVLAPTTGALENALRGLVADSELRREAGTRARALVRDRFDASRVAHAYDRLFRYLAGLPSTEGAREPERSPKASPRRKHARS